MTNFFDNPSQPQQRIPQNFTHSRQTETRQTAQMSREGQPLFEQQEQKTQTLTRNTGSIVDNDNQSLTTANPAVTALSDVHLLEKLSHFNRERIPERVVHAKGAGAFGTFTVTNDLTKYTRASVFSRVGKKTDILVRFSTVGGSKGSADTARDPRGFAMKMYTDEGIYDMVGNDTPIFFVRDAIKFPDFIHSQKPNPVTNLPDPDAFWDFLSLTPESMAQVTRLFTNNGTPYGFRHMDGFPTHTFMWYNKNNEYFWVRYHFKTQQGIKNFTNDQAVEMAGLNPDFSVQDLYDNITNGNFPKWKVYVQILTPKQAKEYKYNIFDVTKIIYEEDYPLIELGEFTLNKLPTSFFNQIEQAAFCPGNFVPGIGPSPDKMLNARAITYTDTQRHRIGPNFAFLPVNQSRSEVNTYQRDGAMSLYEGNPPSPNYFPNSFNGAAPNPHFTPPAIEVDGTLSRHPEPVTEKDFEQPRRYYVELSSVDKDHLIYNIKQSLGKASKNLQYRQTALFYITDENYGTRVANALSLDLRMVRYLASLSQEKRVQETLN